MSKKTKKLDLDFILGNEHVKRAIEVAIASQQSLLIIGSPDTQIKEIKNNVEFYYDRDGDHLDLIQIWQPCLCGFINHPVVACSCSLEEMKEYLKEKPITDMEVTMVAPQWSDIEKRIKDLDKPSCNLLKVTYEKLHIGYKEVLSIIIRAKAIAEMDKEKIEVRHIAEAIQYCPKK